MNFKSKNKKAFIYLSIASIILLLIFQYTSNYLILCILLGAFGGALIFGILYFMIRFQNLKLSQLRPIHGLIGILIVILSWFEFYISIADGISLMTTKSNTQAMTFRFDNGISIQTSDSLLYLGKSRDFIFLFDKSDKKAFIFNKSTIKSIEKESQK